MQNLKPGTIIFKDSARKLFLTNDGNVDWEKIEQRYDHLRSIQESLSNKHFTSEIKAWAMSLSSELQLRLLDIMLGGLCNEDSNVGVYISNAEDLEIFAKYLTPIIRDYHKIEGEVSQEHNWDIPVGEYLLDTIDSSLANVSMRARVARNVAGWNMPSAMDLEERLRFEDEMEKVFESLPFKGQYTSMTPGHIYEMGSDLIGQMRDDHFLFNDMTTDNHLTCSGIASDWPHGRGIWLSDDKTKMIWIGEEDHVRIISIMHGNDLGVVDKSLSDLLEALEKAGVTFATHSTYGTITTCPTNMGTGKRQSVLIGFPKLTEAGTNEKRLKNAAKKLNLQARGLAGEHSKMDDNGTSDISPMARFGVTEAEVTKILYQGLEKLFKLERSA